MSAFNSAEQEVGRLEVQLEASQRRQQETEKQLEIDEQQVQDDRLKLEAARDRLDEVQISMIVPSTTVMVVADATAPTDGTSTIRRGEVTEFVRRIFRESDADNVSIIVTLPDGEQVPVDFKRDPDDDRQRPASQDIWV